MNAAQFHRPRQVNAASFGPLVHDEHERGALLVQAAVSASRKHGSYLKDQFFRLKVRRAFRRAAVAMARKILVILYHMLKFGRPYQDLGDTYLSFHTAAPSLTSSADSNARATRSSRNQTRPDHS